MTTQQLRQVAATFQQILLQPILFNGARIELHYAIVAHHPKTWVCEPHDHPWFEFNFISRGSLYTTINQARFTVQKGEGFLISPGIVHSHEHTDSDIETLCLRFQVNPEPGSPSGAAILKALTDVQEHPFEISLDKFKPGSNPRTIQAAFVWWLMQLCEKTSTAAPTKLPANLISAQVTLYLEKYYSSNFQVEDIARALNMSYRSMSRHFLDETGMTITDKLTQIRLDKAKQLLVNSKLSLYEIAITCGYKNEFYFSKVFKKSELESPSEYRIRFRRK